MPLKGCIATLYGLYQLDLAGSAGGFAAGPGPASRAGVAAVAGTGPAPSRSATRDRGGRSAA